MVIMFLQSWDPILYLFLYKYVTRLNKMISNFQTEKALKVERSFSCIMMIIIKFL